MSIIGGLLSMLISSPRTIQPPLKHLNLPKEIYPEIYTIKNFDSLSIGDKLKAWVKRNSKIAQIKKKWFFMQFFGHSKIPMISQIVTF